MAGALAKDTASHGHEPLRCKGCGCLLHLRNGRLRSCPCGYPAPRGCWTLRAEPDSDAQTAPVAFVERIESARKPCTNTFCPGLMVFSMRAKRRTKSGPAGSSDIVPAWTCRTCGRQDLVDDTR